MSVYVRMKTITDVCVSVADELHNNLVVHQMNLKTLT